MRKSTLAFCIVFVWGGVAAQEKNPAGAAKTSRPAETAPDKKAPDGKAPDGKSPERGAPERAPPDKTAPGADKSPGLQLNWMVHSPEHDKLQRFAGSWSVQEKLFPGPHGEGGTTQAYLNYRWDLDKLFLYGTYSEKMPTPPGPRYQSRSFFSYDPARKAYRLWWFDNVSGGHDYEGNWQDAETLVMKSTGTAGGKPYTVTVTFHFTAEDTLQLRGVRQAEGPPQTLFESTYTRRVFPMRTPSAPKPEPTPKPEFKPGTLKVKKK